MKIILLFFASLLVTHSAFSVQKFEASPDEVIQITASMSDANVITISGGSIESVWGTEDKVTLEANVDTGQAIFRPISPEPFTLFVQSEAGHTYTLSVVPRNDIIGQIILLNEFDQGERPAPERSAGGVAYRNDVKSLLRKMEQQAGVKNLPGFQLKAINKPVLLWAETKILHAVSWSRASMIIDKYLVTNVSEKPLVLEEREFRGLDSMIRAIALRQHQLQPAETTVLYTFRSRS